MAAAEGLVLIQPVQVEQISCTAISLIGTNVENDLGWECLLGAQNTGHASIVSPRMNRMEMGMQQIGHS